MAILTGPRGRSVNLMSHTHFSMMKLVVLIFSAVSYVAAYEMRAMRGVDQSQFYQELAQRGEIHIDVRSPQQGSNSNSATASPSLSARPSGTQGSTITAAASATPDSSSKPSSTISSSSTTTDPTILPSPFDTSLGNNFTVQSCPTFFNNFINNATFKSCLPVSLLLQNSMMFFKATKSATYLDKVLDNACEASLVMCSPLMASIADQLTDDTNCGQDYRKQNPLVMQAYVGLLSYEPLYTATCVMSKTSKNYCFVDAIVNNTNTADLNPYYLPLGVSLPDTTQPTCNSCLQQTMNIFANYAGQKNQPLSKTYAAAAQQINGPCGAAFVNTSVQTTGKSRNAASSSRISVLVVGVTTAVLSLLIVT